MERRRFIQVAMVSLTALVQACGGGDSGDSSDASTDSDEGYRHAWGIDMLPDAAPINPLRLTAQASSGFSVSVHIGSQPQAHVPVQIFDANNTQVDAGITDANGLYVSQFTGKYYLYAVAQTARGELSGYELNDATKTFSVINVNLVSTLTRRLDAQLKLQGKSAEFVIERFFNLSLDTPLSDLDISADGFDQDLLRQDYEASGLSLPAYLDRRIADIFQEIDSGFSEEPQAARNKGRSSQSQGQSLARLGAHASDEACVPVPYEYSDIPFSLPDDSPFNAEDPLAELIKRHWPSVTKSILEFGLKKAGEIIAGPAGGAISGIGSMILSAVLPPADPVQKAINQFYDEIQALLNEGIQKVITAIKKVEFTSAHKEIKDYFEQFDQQLRNIRSLNTQFEKIKSPTELERQQYNEDMLKYSRSIIALEDNLTTCHQLLFGVGAYGPVDSVLKKWFEYRDVEIYTSQLQDEFMAILDHFMMWATLIQAAIIDAHECVARLDNSPSKKPVNTARVRILEQRLVDISLNIELIRPSFLPTARMIVDVPNKTAWVGRCNKHELQSLLPWMDVRPIISNAINAAMRYTDPNEKCYPAGSPEASASITRDVVDTLEWNFPSRRQVEATFTNRIKKAMKADKKFNLATFKEKNHIPACFFLMQEGSTSKGVKFALNYYLEQFNPLSGRYTGMYEVDMYEMEKLNFKSREILNPRVPTYPFFPSAVLQEKQLKAYVPWLKYPEIYNKLKVLG